MTSTRIIAAMVGLAILMPAVFWGGPIAVWVIVGIAMVICFDEYARMAFADDHRAAFVWLTVAGLGVPAASILGSRSVFIAVATLSIVVTMSLVTLRPGPSLERAADRVGRFVLGIAWIGMLSFLVRMRSWESGIAWVMLVLAVSWLSDTGAYFAGRRFGRTKLAPRVSPKKTVEGFVGGVLTAVLGVFVMRATVLPGLTMPDAVAIGVLGSSMGVMGDLCESLLKRAYDVKDSGWILPGHGGMLDRIDSVLFVAPCVWSYMVLAHGA